MAQRVDAAASWADNVALQVTVKEQTATTAVGNQKAQVTFSFDLFPGDAKLRVIKLASKKDALSGEIVDFTIRYDNVGEQPIGNVTLLDNLTTRLEFVRKTDQSSNKANFSFKENDSGSVTLRWELEEPLKPGKGGVVRFKCRVR